MCDHPIQATCTSLTTLIRAIHAKKLEDGGLVEEDMIADTMALFGQLVGQHHNLVKEAELEYDKIYDVSCVYGLFCSIVLIVLIV